MYVCIMQLNFIILWISLTGLPDPFAKILVDGSGQVYSTNVVKATLEPKWNTHYDLYLTKGDGITIRYEHIHNNNKSSWSTTTMAANHWD